MNNSISLVGRVSQAPVSTTFSDTENKLAKFSLAVADYTSKADNAEPMYIEVECWNGLAERVMKYITVGREVALSGRLSISKYTKTIGDTKIEMKRAVVKLSGFHLCGKRPESAEEAGEAKPEKKSKTAA